MQIHDPFGVRRLKYLRLYYSVLKFAVGFILRVQF